MTIQPAPTQHYDAAELDRRLRAALPAPALRLLFTGPVGSGKSTVLASVPVPAGKTRLVLDFEDSMAYLDAGPDGEDLYLPRRHVFRMERLVFPALSEVAEACERLLAADASIGALVIDNISLLQDQIADLLQSGNVRQIRNVFARFGVDHFLPVDGMLARWAQQRDPSFWAALKLIPKRLVLTCLKHRIHFVASTEEGNLWKNYGKTNAEVIGKKANALKTWMQFTDAVIYLERDPNTLSAPLGKINPLQPKMRIQGMNPSWPMDWPGFVAELESASLRDQQPIPASAQVSRDVISEEPEVQLGEGDEARPENRTRRPTARRATAAAATSTPASRRHRDVESSTSSSRRSENAAHWPTRFWTYVKAHNLDGQALLAEHGQDFEAACRELGLAAQTNGAQLEVAA